MNTVAVIEWLENAKYNLETTRKSVAELNRVRIESAIQQITSAISELGGGDDK